MPSYRKLENPTFGCHCERSSPLRLSLLALSRGNIILYNSLITESHSSIDCFALSNIGKPLFNPPTDRKWGRIVPSAAKTPPQIRKTTALSTAIPLIKRSAPPEKHRFPVAAPVQVPVQITYTSAPNHPASLLTFRRSGELIPARPAHLRPAIFINAAGLRELSGDVPRRNSPFPGRLRRGNKFGVPFK